MAPPLMMAIKNHSVRISHITLFPRTRFPASTRSPKIVIWTTCQPFAAIGWHVVQITILGDLVEAGNRVLGNKVICDILTLWFFMAIINGGAIYIVSKYILLGLKWVWKKLLRT